MLDLVSISDISYVLDNENDRPDDVFLTGEIRRARQIYRGRPGFSQPYKTGEEFVGELIAPVVYPIEFIGSAVCTGLMGVISVGFIVGWLLTAAGAGLFGNATLRDEAWGWFVDSAIVLGLTILETTAALLLAVISLPYSLLALATRSVATVFSALFPLFTKAPEKPVLTEVVIDGDERKTFNITVPAIDLSRLSSDLNDIQSMHEQSSRHFRPEDFPRDFGAPLFQEEMVIYQHCDRDFYTPYPFSQPHDEFSTSQTIQQPAAAPVYGHALQKQGLFSREPAQYVATDELTESDVATFDFSKFEP
jgi:hypothetical protein